MKPYKTVIGRGTDEFTEKRSRFVGNAAPCESAEEALAFLDEIKNRYKDVSHHCYGYIIGENKGVIRYSDAGEPQGTAGMPIIDVMNKNDVTNCCIVVTRWFGGILLGAGGLTRAYSHAASIAVAAAGVGVMHPTCRLLVDVPYPMLSKFEYYLKTAPAEVEDKSFTDIITFTLLVKQSDEERLNAEITQLSDGKLSTVRFDEFFKPWEE